MLEVELDIGPASTQAIADVHHSVTNHSACRFGETPLRLRTARQDIRKIPEQRTNAERQRLAYVYRYVPKADISFSKCR